MTENTTAKAAAPKAAPRRRAAARSGNPQADRAARDQAPAPKAPAPKAPAKAAYRVPAGYSLRWPHGSYDLLKKDDKAVEGPAWWVVCTAHGEMTEVKNARDGDVKGRKSDLPLWCKGHKADARKRPVRAAEKAEKAADAAVKEAARAAKAIKAPAKAAEAHAAEAAEAAEAPAKK